MPIPRVAVVVPIWERPELVGPLVDACVAELSQWAVDWSLVLVDDGSTDSTWSTIASAVESNDRVGGVRLAGNVGQLRAFYGVGALLPVDVLVSLDADLEVCPAQIPLVVGQLGVHVDVVSGVRRGPRSAPIVRRAGSRSFGLLSRHWLGLSMSDPGCGLKAFPAETVQFVATSAASTSGRLGPFVGLANLDPSVVELPVEVDGVARDSSHRTRSLGRAALQMMVSDPRRAPRLPVIGGLLALVLGRFVLSRPGLARIAFAALTWIALRTAVGRCIQQANAADHQRLVVAEGAGDPWIVQDEANT